MKFENSERLRRAFLIRAESATTIFHFSFFILHFNKVVRYEDLNGWVGGKRRTRSARFQAARGNVFIIKKRKTAAGEPPGKGNLYEDKKCKIKPV